MFVGNLWTMRYWYNDRETVMAILKLYDTLCHHSFCNFHEACDISTFDVVDITIFIGTVFDALLVNTAKCIESVVLFP